MLDGDPVAFAAKLKELNQRRNDLNQGTPFIPRHDSEAARRGIETDEAQHQVDKTR